MASASQTFVLDNLHFTEADLEMIIAPEMPLFQALPADSVDVDLMDFFFFYETLPNFIDLKNKTLPYF